jgi:predicted esterase
MSAGENDPVATSQITESSRAAVEREGFKNVRYEKFPGSHEMWQPHLAAALDWFLVSRKATGTSK